MTLLIIVGVLALGVTISCEITHRWLRSIELRIAELESRRTTKL